MALRNLEYTALLYGALDRRGELGPPGGWPVVLPCFRRRRTGTGSARLPT